MFVLTMLKSGLVLVLVLLVFALGKSPVFRVDRAGAAIIGGALTVAMGVLSFDQAAQAIDYRTIVLLFSMMIVTANLKLAGFFPFVGNYLLAKIKTRRQLLLSTILASGILSAFFINDIICLLFTPVVLMICRHTKTRPAPYLIGIATASNIGSAGTLLGNPQNILIGSISKLPFLKYMAYAFPVAAVGLLVNYFLLVYFYSSCLQGDLESQLLNGFHHGYLIKKSLLVTCVILLGFLVGIEPAVIASLGAAYLLLTRRLKPNKVYNSIDFNLLVIFIGLFVVIEGVERSGLSRWMLERLEFINFNNFSLFALLTVFFSNIFSNVPAVMLLKSFIPANGGQIWWIGLGVFSTLAGNLTLTGSIANLIVVEVARQDGEQITFMEYLRIGFPLTVLLTGSALLYFWLLGG